MDALATVVIAALVCESVSSVRLADRLADEDAPLSHLQQLVRLATEVTPPPARYAEFEQETLSQLPSNLQLLLRQLTDSPPPPPPPPAARLASYDTEPQPPVSNLQLLVRQLDSQAVPPQPPSRLAGYETEVSSSSNDLLQDLRGRYGRPKYILSVADNDESRPLESKSDLINVLKSVVSALEEDNDKDSVYSPYNHKSEKLLQHQQGPHPNCWVCSVMHAVTHAVEGTSCPFCSGMSPLTADGGQGVQPKVLFQELTAPKEKRQQNSQKLSNLFGPLNGFKEFNIISSDESI